MNRRWISAIAAAAGCVACGGDRPVGPASRVEPSFASISITLDKPAIEPLDVEGASLRAFDAGGESMAQSPKATWVSSDTSVASVVGTNGTATIRAHKPGDAVVTASTGGLSARATIHVAWDPTTTLSISRGATTLAIGDVLTFAVDAKHRLPNDQVTWTSSDSAVVRLDGPGNVLAVAPGTAFLIARVLGLADSIPIVVRRGPLGFGYAYSDLADETILQYYYFDQLDWAPGTAKAFSSSNTDVALSVLGPYGTYPDFGWISPQRPRGDAMWHAVSLSDARCAVSADNASNSFWAAGASVVTCTRPRSASAPYWSLKFEAVAFRADEFSGTLALVRPGIGPSSTTSGGLVELDRSAGRRVFSMPGVSADSVFWFTTATGAVGSACAVAPRNAVSPMTVAIICPPTLDGGAPSLYAVGFGADARRDVSPIGFIEFDERGVVRRSVADGLDITTALAADAVSTDVVVSGPRLAAFRRLPAILLTAVADVAAACSMTEPRRDAPTIVTFRVRCDDGSRGATIGVIY